MKFFVLLFVLVILEEGICDLSCRDEDGSPVDWFIVIKIPLLKSSSSRFISQGLGYMSMSAQRPKLKISGKSIGNASSIVGITLDPLYSDGHDDLLSILFNDERPNGEYSLSKGHTKGVAAFDSTTGFWLIHSVPKFPPVSSTGYSYPHSGRIYGQSFLCISVSNVTIDDIGKQLLYNDPNVYDCTIPSWVVNDQFPHFQNACKSQQETIQGSSHIIELTSLHGQKFTSFAKSKTFNKDLYAQLVAPNLETNLLVETWPNGRGEMSSWCNMTYQVHNVDDLHFAFPKDEVTYSRHHDHSKWAIADRSPPYICVGDINRMNTQLRRAGGTVCFQNQPTWKAFKSSIEDLEPCPICKGSSAGSNNRVELLTLVIAACLYLTQ